MGPTVALSSSDGRFNVNVAGDDVELIASVLLLLEVPVEPGLPRLDDISRWRQWRDNGDNVRGLVHPAPAA